MSENSTNPSNATNASNSSNPSLVEVFTIFFRAITRPAVTIIFAAVIAQVVIDKIEAPSWFLGLASGCILWWFSDRTVQHIKEKKEQT